MAAHHVFVYETAESGHSGEKVASARKVPLGQFVENSDKKDFMPFKNYIRDDSGSVMCFGYECILTADKIFSEKNIIRGWIESGQRADADK